MMRSLKIKKLLSWFLILNLIVVFLPIKTAYTQIPKNPENTTTPAALDINTTEEEVFSIFDDKQLLEGYTKKYTKLPKKTVLAMIKDDTLSEFKAAAAIRVFKGQYSLEVVSAEKRLFEKFILRRFARSESPFVHIEIMHTLCELDRYRYFNSMVPALIQKLDHYNSSVNEIAYQNLLAIVENSNRPREARVVFNTLRKVLFLSRKKLANIQGPDERLKQKLKLLRWSIKILGTQELKRLPKEVISLL